jgi:hypothetical protein
MFIRDQMFTVFAAFATAVYKFADLIKIRITLNTSLQTSIVFTGKKQYDA